ncbi:MAG TPA: heme-binding protein [Methylovirgula sp.]
MSVSLDQAEALVKTARAKAAEIGVAASIVVLDEAGHLKAFARMEHAWLGSIDVAMKKARTSVLFQMETQQVLEVCKPGAQAQGLELTNDGLVTFAGGIPLKTSGGQLIGALGVSGGQVAQDFEIARAGLSALSA